MITLVGKPHHLVNVLVWHRTSLAKNEKRKKRLTKSRSANRNYYYLFPSRLKINLYLVFRKAREEALNGLYQRLGIREGKKELF